MTNSIATQHPELWPPHGYDAVAEVAALSEAVRNTVTMAAGLAAGGRQVDLTGLDRTMGLLCAKALDLAAVDGRTARTGLIALLTEVDALSLALRAEAS